MWSKLKLGAAGAGELGGAARGWWGRLVVGESRCVWLQHKGSKANGMRMGIVWCVTTHVEPRMGICAESNYISLGAFPSGSAFFFDKGSTKMFDIF